MISELSSVLYILLFLGFLIFLFGFFIFNLFFPKQFTICSFWQLRLAFIICLFEMFFFIKKYIYTMDIILFCIDRSLQTFTMMPTIYSSLIFYNHNASTTSHKIHNLHYRNNTQSILTLAMATT